MIVSGCTAAKHGFMAVFSYPPCRPFIVKWASASMEEFGQEREEDAEQICRDWRGNTSRLYSQSIGISRDYIVSLPGSRVAVNV